MKIISLNLKNVIIIFYLLKNIWLIFFKIADKNKSVQMRVISVRLSKRGSIVLPAKLRKEMRLKEGSYFLLTQENDKIILQPISSFTEKLAGLTAGCFGDTAKEIQDFIDEERKER